MSGLSRGLITRRYGRSECRVIGRPSGDDFGELTIGGDGDPLGLFEAEIAFQRGASSLAFWGGRRKR